MRLAPGNTHILQLPSIRARIRAEGALHGDPAAAMFLVRRTPQTRLHFPAAVRRAARPIVLSYSLTTPDNRVSASFKSATKAPLEKLPPLDTNSTTNQQSAKKERQQWRVLDMLKGALEEAIRASRDLGWGAHGLRIRVAMLALHKKGKTTTGVPREAMMVELEEAPPDRVEEWERLLRWAHASYGRNEKVVVKRTGLNRDELEMIAISSGKDRGRPMAPTYVLAVDHGHKEIVVSVRGTKALGDAITISHFRPEPFLGGYAHRGFAQSAHELVKEIEPQLVALRQRLPDYRVCFTGHSMGGGVATMASILLREKYSPKKMQDGGADSGITLEFGNGDGGTPQDLASARREHGCYRGVEVVSFATPCCVSLDLAQSCAPWVKTIVYADDVVPRLSTVALDLLEQDLTAEEWRNVVAAMDRLARLSLARPTLNFPAKAVIDTVKGALDGGLGSLSLAKRLRNAKDGDRQGQAQLPASSAASREREKEGGRGSDGDGGAREGPSRQGKNERFELRRSLRDTVMTMRGLAEIYPLPIPFRQEIESVSTQVMRLIRGEKARTNTDGNRSNGTRVTDSDGTKGHPKTPPRAGGADSAKGGGDDALHHEDKNSGPQLLTRLKANIVSLVNNRAALQRSNSGSSAAAAAAAAADGGGGGEEFHETRADVGAKDVASIHSSVENDGVVSAELYFDEGTSSEPVPFSCADDHGNLARSEESRDATADKGVDLVDTRDVAAQKATGSEEMDASTITESDHSVGGTPSTRKIPQKSSNLHELFLSKEEPTLYPMYPPGDPMLICNASRQLGASPSAQAAAMAEAVGGSTVVQESSKDLNSSGGSADVNSVSIHSNASLAIDRARDNVEKRVDRDAEAAASARTVDDGRGDGGAATWSQPGDEKAEESERSRDIVAAVKKAVSNAIKLDRLGRKKSVDTDGPKEDERIVLVRVPHQHFLRMPVNPRMISDHQTSSYRHGLAAIKKRGTS